LSSNSQLQKYERLNKQTKSPQEVVIEALNQLTGKKNIVGRDERNHGVWVIKEKVIELVKKSAKLCAKLLNMMVASTHY
tara:strand:- start:146 stop:382 length:237 start_codon:yes stop_codon:yes gene_type:complete